MSNCFIICNQLGHFLSKKKTWVDGSDNNILFRCKHKDEAINMVVEISSKDIHLRAEAISCELNAKKNPVVTISETPLPIQEIAIEEDNTKCAESTDG